MDLFASLSGDMSAGCRKVAGGGFKYFSRAFLKSNIPSEHLIHLKTRSNKHKIVTCSEVRNV